MIKNNSRLETTEYGFRLGASRDASRNKINESHKTVNVRSFDKFFHDATGNTPYDYQRRLACGEQINRIETPCQSQLINIPTGLGKTAAVVLAWLWNRVELKKTDWPRRLVYCLPMRTLVEQTQEEVCKWLGDSSWDGDPENRKGKVGVHILMGGEDAGEWDIYPEENAILIGTQDMLLARALNRGYGMSRYRWPMHFGLLNNDCLWVMDETQLMGPGLGTAAQLEAFRSNQINGFGSVGGAGSVTWYMSATNNPQHLKTREWRDVTRPPEFELSLSTEEKSATAGPVHQRRHAVKVLKFEPASGFVDSIAAQALVTAIVKRHKEMAEAIAGEPKLPVRTLIICNTVDHAVAVHAILKSEKTKSRDLLLLHSRFRPPERKAQMERLKAIDVDAFPEGQIVVATQVIEAGFDVSSAILYSEIAPLASLVQRLGRINRTGEFQNSVWQAVAIIVGIGVESESTGKNEKAKQEIRNANIKRCLPYELTACDPECKLSAWESLRRLNGNASPANLEEVQDDIAASIPRCPYSLHRHELTDFFDTDANLSLGFTDVSPFVRGLDEDTDLQVCWREAWSEDDVPPDFSPDYQRDELCSLPISKALKAREVLNRGWLWRGKENDWISVRDAGLAPGMAILLPLSAGGYDNAAGWTGDKVDNKHSSHYQPGDEPSDEEQLSCLANGWRSIAAHTTEVGDELSDLLRILFDQDVREPLVSAVQWHDVGKNHPNWQQAVVRALEMAGIAGKNDHLPFAKFSLSDSPLLRNPDGLLRYSGRELKREVNKLRRFFCPEIAHEVASALAFRQSEQKRLGPSRDTDISSLLTEYVIMSHHGRVRKVLRDELPRFPDSDPDTKTVRGVTDGSVIPPVQIEGKKLDCESLSTDCRRMGRDVSGRESYTRGVLRLLENYGPFRLAFFEAVFRAADIRASIAVSREHNA